jgi:hypothetical protein
MVTVLLLFTSGVLALFLFYPVFIFFHNQQQNNLIDANIRINTTGKLLVIVFLDMSVTDGYSFQPGTSAFQLPDLIDIQTPQSAHKCIIFCGQASRDEINTHGRTFYPGTSSRLAPPEKPLTFCTAHPTTWNSTTLYR